jgi:hypothetical protein
MTAHCPRTTGNRARAAQAALLDCDDVLAADVLDPAEGIRPAWTLDLVTDTGLDDDHLAALAKHGARVVDVTPQAGATRTVATF